LDGVILVAGITQGSQGQQPSQGGLDAFIAWLSPDGRLERVLQFGTSGDERVGSLILDEQENIYVAGDTTGSLPFASGEGAQFVVKFSPDGELLWARSLGGDLSYAPPVIALDGAGALVVAGSQPNGITALYSWVGQQPFYDAYLAEFTPDGELVTSSVFTVDAAQVPTEILPLEDGTFVILGLQSHESFTGDGPPKHGFAAVIDLEGGVLRYATITLPGDNTFPVLGVLLEDGEMAITTGTGLGVGQLEDKCVDRPGFSCYSYYAAIGVFDQRLETVWLKSFGKAKSYVGTGVAFDPAGDLVLVGFGKGDVGGEPQGASDVFVGAYSVDGERLWLTQYGTPEFDRANGVVVSGDGEIIVIGSWNGDEELIVHGLPGIVLDLGKSWLIAAHAPDGERLWMRTYAATDAASSDGP
jgi:hypothetical protein